MISIEQGEELSIIIHWIITLALRMVHVKCERIQYYSCFIEYFVITWALRLVKGDRIQYYYILITPILRIGNVKNVILCSR